MSSLANGPDPLEQARAWLAQQGASVGPAPAEPRREETAPSPDSAVGAVSRPVVNASRARSQSPAVAGASRRGAEREPQVEVENEADASSVARRILTRQLVAHDRTRRELGDALGRRNVPPEVAAETLERFAELGLIDDRAFARRWVESRQTRRHRSRQALRRELDAKGVARDVVDEVLGDVTADQELAAARAYVEKTTHALRGLPDDVRRRRLADRLARRGFAGEVIRRALKDLPNECGLSRSDKVIDCLTAGRGRPTLQTARSPATPVDMTYKPGPPGSGLDH